jgi:hypothetical protein
VYIPSHHFEEPEQEVVCLLTGESYVYLEGNDLTLIDPKYHDGAIERLPERFFQHPLAVNKGGNQVKIILKNPHI